MYTLWRCWKTCNLCEERSVFQMLHASFQLLEVWVTGYKDKMLSLQLLIQSPHPFEKQRVHLNFNFQRTFQIRDGADSWKRIDSWSVWKRSVVMDGQKKHMCWSLWYWVITAGGSSPVKWNLAPCHWWLCPEGSPCQASAERTTGEMLLTFHLLLLLVLHVYGQQERDRACTMLIVVDQVNHQSILSWWIYSGWPVGFLILSTTILFDHIIDQLSTFCCFIDQLSTNHLSLTNTTKGGHQIRGGTQILAQTRKGKKTPG